LAKINYTKVDGERTMNVREIVVKNLKETDFDGLCNVDNECGCGLDDLAPCCDNILACEPAIEVVPPTNDFDRFFADKGWDQTERIKFTKK